MMQRLAHDWRMAVVCVSHDVNLAARFADELVLMRGGKVAAAGAPRQVVREDVLSSVYDVDIEIISTGGDSPSIVRAR
jgi:iron complex transport system ATP-binding protein